MRLSSPAAEFAVFCFRGGRSALAERSSSRTSARASLLAQRSLQAEGAVALLQVGHSRKALLVTIGYIAVSALLGLLVRRWWLLAVVLVLWIVMVGDALARDDFISYQNTRAGYVGITVIAFLIPAELGAALGIILGRRWLATHADRAA